jgi:AcrR family transcriptional regulator
VQSLRQTQKEQRRGLILQAARDMVATEGLAALTMRSLSAAAGVSVPTIYNLVGSRDDVLAAMLAAGGAAYAASLPTAPTGPASLATALDAFAEQIIANRAVVRELLGHRGATLPGPATVVGALHDSLRAGFARARTDGVLRADADPEVTAVRAVALVGGAVVAWASAGDDERLRADLDHVRALLLAAYATDAARARLTRELRRADRRLREAGPAASERPAGDAG